MRRSGRTEERAASSLEFALMFSFVVFPLIIGVIQYGYQFWSLQTAAATAREAARHLAIGADPCQVRAQAQDHAAEPSMGAVTVSDPTYYDASGQPTPKNQPQIGGLVKVTVSFSSLDLGLLPVPSKGVVSETAEATVQNVHAGTDADPFIGVDGVQETGAPTVTLPSC